MGPGQSSPSASRLTLLVGLLAATVFLAALLAFEAHGAARAERVTAERALRDYATVAAWELRSAARKRLDGALTRALGPVTTGAAVSPYEMLPSLDVLRTSAERELVCRALSDVASRGYFRVDLRDGSFASLPADMPEAVAIKPAVHDFVRDVAKPEQPLGTVRATPPGSGLWLALGVRYARLGAPVAVYGFTTCAAALAAPFFRAVLDEHALLPSSAGGGAPNDSLFSIAIVDRAGDTTFAARAPDASPFSADILLDGWDGWRAEVVIRSIATQQLLARPPLRSRVPLLVGLLVTTAALALVALLQIRREHQLARLRADFTSSVSHELRTPLAQILLFGETLSLGRARSAGERRFAAETIVQEARRLMHMVDNVLTFSHERRERTDVTPRSIPMRPVLEAIVASFSPLARASAVRLEIDLESAPEALVEPGALRQIVLNLLDNAVKYGPYGQTVRVTCRASGDRVRLIVEDEGPGIAPSDRERIWSPYVRLRRTGQGGRGGGVVGGGSGIGLAVVRELTESLGGRVWVEESAGRGARFVVELARTGSLAAGSPPESNMSAPPRSEQDQFAAIGIDSSPTTARPDRLA